MAAPAQPTGATPLASRVPNAPSTPKGGPYSLGPYPRHRAAPAALPGGGMRGAAATAVSLADSRMYDPSDRAEACRRACVTRGRGAPAWKGAASAPLRALCVPK